MNKSKPMNVSYSTTPIGERLTDALKVNRLHAGITKAVNKRGLLPDIKGLYKHLSGMRGNFHVPFFEEGERVIALPYSTLKIRPILENYRKGLMVKIILILELLPFYL